MLCIVCCGLWPVAHAQYRISKGGKAPTYGQRHAFDTVQLRFADTVITTDGKGIITHGVCKDYRMRYPLLVFNQPGSAGQPYQTPVNTSPPLLKISGNILYDLNYRSRLDTPYAASDVYQHTVQTHLDVLYKGQYPMRIYLTSRFSNSPLFRRYTDLNFQFNAADFSRIIRERMMNAVTSYVLSQTKEADSLKQLLEEKKASFLALSGSLQKPDLAQQTVEERELALLRNNRRLQPADPLPKLPGLSEAITQPVKYKFAAAGKGEAADNDSARDRKQEYKALREKAAADKKKLDSVASEITKLEQLYHKAETAKQAALTDWHNAIEQTKDTRVLTERLKQLHLPDSVLPKGYKTMLAIQRFSIGRSTVDYSELSVKNTSITGLQLEYNPHNYYAIAVGKVNYRFRDYIVPNGTNANQYLALVRFGKGIANGNHIIVTGYMGRRQFFNAAVTTTAGGSIPSYQLAGITVEGLYRLNRNISVVGELAKSTMPYYTLDSVQKKEWLQSVAKFKEHSNEAYSVRLNGYFPATQTRITGSMRWLGARFQSFSTFTTGTAQTQWLAKLEQAFWKKRLRVMSSVQKSDFSNPYIATTYSNTSVLYSLQATLRLKKGPVFSAGYYPSYQLTKTGDDSYSQSRYYTLMGSAAWYYNWQSVQLSSYALYSQFYNQSSDSGFVYFNARNYMFSQGATINRLTLQLIGSLSTGEGYRMYTGEHTAQFAFSKLFSAGAGIKAIRYTLASDLLWGYSGNCTLTVPKVGELQLMLDQGYLPALNKTLAPNKLGRLTYIKTF
jgi:hypothetical protein